MYQVDDKPETIHLYVVREVPPRPNLTPIILSLLGLSLLIGLGVTAPYTQSVMRLAIRVPAVPLYLKSFQASIKIIPTGVRSYPATFAHGTLTISNGSIIGQAIPADFTVQGVVTDKAVYVPAGDANDYGKAIVAAHAVMPGVNLPKLAVNAVIGSSLFIRNLNPFTGGHPAYSVHFVTEQDKQTALVRARDQLVIVTTGLHYPCLENQFHDVVKMVLTWRCQFITYHIPSYMHVLSVRLEGKNLLLEVAFTPFSRPGWVK